MDKYIFREIIAETYIYIYIYSFFCFSIYFSKICFLNSIFLIFMKAANRTGTGNREPVHAEPREPNARTEPREPNRILRTEPDDVNRFTERCEPVPPPLPPPCPRPPRGCNYNFNYSFNLQP